jgi:hypothetical protein
MAANTVKLAIRQHPQQARLGIQRHIPDFIQKQRAVVGLLKSTLTQGGCAGKSPLSRGQTTRTPSGPWESRPCSEQ